ncbi:MAG: hypothetical protein PHW96_01745 [Candidatus Nanoarchaeia archaeon]|nr:hypothetical protein [Candidatus Nanoarchaeia archaeon]
MRLEEYCMEKGYGISEIDLKRKDHKIIGCPTIISKKDIKNVLKKQNKTLNGVIEEKVILENGDKKIVFAKDWNEQCHGSALFLEGDFYFGIDGHLDFAEDFIWTRKPEYYCGDYREFIMEEFAGDKKKLFFMLDTEHCHNNKEFCFEQFKPHKKEDMIYFDYVVFKEKWEDNKLAFDNIKKILKDKEGNKKSGVLCIDHDILCPYDIHSNNLDRRYMKKWGIEFNVLKSLVKGIMENSEILTLYIDVPFYRKDFLEKILE